MGNGWDGADPTQENEPGVDYELGTRYTAAVDVAITGIRVWHGANSESVVGRTGRVWTTAGVQLGSVPLDATLAPGWTVYEFAEPIIIAAAASFDVSYSTVRFYGATPGGYPNPSADAALTATQGRFHNTPGTHPNTVSPAASFYGIDVTYELAGNLAPVVTALTVVADQLDVVATVVIDDESPESVTVRWLWGDDQETLTGGGVLTDDHTYAAPGLYAVAVVATDNAGQKGVRAAPVLVRDDAGLLDIHLAIGEIAARLETITGLNVAAYGPGAGQVTTPAAFPTLPTEAIRYHETYDQGGPGASAKIPVVVALGKRHTPSVYAELAEYLAAGGSRSIRAVLESGAYTAFDDIAVPDGTVDEMPIAGTSFVVAVFTVEIMK